MSLDIPPDEFRNDMLLAMALETRENALARLSDKGKDVLEQMDYTQRWASMDPVEVFTEATAYDELPQPDRFAIEIYAARMTLIQSFWSYKHPDDPDAWEEE